MPRGRAERGQGSSRCLGEEQGPEAASAVGRGRRGRAGGRGCEGRLEQVLSGSGAVAVPGLESLCAAAAPGRDGRTEEPQEEAGPPALHVAPLLPGDAAGTAPLQLQLQLQLGSASFQLLLVVAPAPGWRFLPRLVEGSSACGSSSVLAAAPLHLQLDGLLQLRLQLMLVKTILAFDEVVNQSLS
ncbi:uncharacterized protein [Ciconia boyciana]|uniref:uncharacterized protein isoform X3 n=1 Tax=Ciconia boyciana TaxID=52775 RepID=UPI003BA1B768